MIKKLNALTKLKLLVSMLVLFVVFVLIVQNISESYLTVSKINNIIDQRTKLPLQVKFDRAHIGFSGGLYPFFAVKFNNLKLDFIDCEVSYRLKSPSLLVPVFMSTVIDNKPRFGYIKSKLVSVEEFENSNKCGVDQKNVFKKINSIGSKNRYKKGFEKLEKAFDFVGGLRWLQFNYINRKQKLFQVNDVTVTYNRKDSTLYSFGELNIQPYNPKVDNQILKIKLNAVASMSNGLKLEAKARHHEGRFEVTSKAQKKLDDYNINVYVKDLPLTFINFFNQYKEMKLVNAHKIWYNSAAKVNFKNFFNSEKKETDIHLENLQLYGPLLNLSADKFSLKVAPKLSLITSVDWRLGSVNLDMLFVKERLSDFDGIINHFGSLEGSGILRPDQKLYFEGKLKDLAFVFSMNGRKAVQKVKSANVKVKYLKEKLSLSLENFILAGGAEFEGNLQGQLNWQEEFIWSMRLNSSLLKLSESVLELYQIKQSAFEQLIFTAEGQGRELQSMSLTAALNDLSTKWGKFNNSEYKLVYQPDEKDYVFTLLSKSFNLDPKFIDIKPISDVSEIKDFMTELTLNQDKKSFDLKAYSNSKPKISLSASGVDFKSKFTSTLIIQDQEHSLVGDIDSGFKIK